MPNPTIKISPRTFVFGSMAMSVALGVITLLLVAFLPLLLVTAAGFTHSSIFKMHMLFVVLFVLGISFALNTLIIGRWCFNGLFETTTKRVFVSVFILCWIMLMYYINAADYFDVALSVVILVWAIWDKVRGREEPI
jgi:hypothetical protein